METNWIELVFFSKEKCLCNSSFNRTGLLMAVEGNGKAQYIIYWSTFGIVTPFPLQHEKMTDVFPNSVHKLSLPENRKSTEENSVINRKAFFSVSSDGYQCWLVLIKRDRTCLSWGRRFYLFRSLTSTWFFFHELLSIFFPGFSLTELLATRIRSYSIQSSFIGFHRVSFDGDWILLIFPIEHLGTPIFRWGEGELSSRLLWRV